MKELFDIVLAELNSGDFTFEGNFVFKFFTDGMSIYRQVEGKLVSEEINTNPFGVVTAIPVVFTEGNKRVDWAIQFVTFIRVEGQEYDDTVDLEYAHVESVMNALNGSIKTGTNKYSFKVQPVDRQGMIVTGENNFVPILINMNVTQINTGEFCQETSVFTLTDGTTTITLDPVEGTLGSTKRYYQSDDKTTETNDYSKPIGRAFVATFTINYISSNDLHYKLFLETRGKSDLSQIYTLTETTSRSTSLVYNVTVKNASEVYQKNKVTTLSFEVVEV